MSTELLDGFLPYETFEVLVRYGPEEILSPLEIEVIHAIGSGVNRLDRLVDLYRLGNRPMFDLVSDLWKVGYLSVNLHDSTLHVDKDLEQRIRKRDFEDLARTEVKEQRVLLMQELVTGTVLPVLAHTTTNNSYQIIPQLLPFGSFREIDQSNMVDLASRLSFNRLDKARAYKILDAYLPARISDVGTPSVVRRLLQLKLECSRRQDRPIAVIASPTELDGQIKLQLEQAIGNLVEERPDDPFCRRFLDHLEKQSVQVTGGAGWALLEDLLADLGQRIEGLEKCPIEEQQARHKALTERAELALEVFRQRRAQRVRVRLLPNPEKTFAAVATALGQARQQVVLCSPRASYTTVSKHWDLIEGLLERGVSFFFLWGDSRASVLDKQVERNLIGLASRKNNAHRLHWCREGIGTNESFLLVDGSLGILSGFSLLADARSIPEMSPAVEFRSLDKGSCGAVVSLLDRVRRNMLDYALARSFSEFASRTEGNEPTTSIPTIPDPPIRPDENSELASTDTAMLYPNAWKQFLKELQATTAGLGESVETVFDGRHRQLLMQTLASRPANLLLASHWISLDALNPEVEDKIAACAVNGAAISIIYDSGRRKDTRAVERVVSLDTRFPGLRGRQLHTTGGVMATDAFVLVSGFDILGTPGFLQQDPRRRRLEGGVLVQSPDFAAEVFRLFDHHQGALSAHREDRRVILNLPYSGG